MKKLLIAVALTLSSLSFADVWHTNSQWNETYKEDFKSWISTETSTDMFTNRTSPYYGIKVDCADVTYALKAVYAYENNLPFKVRNPVYKKGHKYKYWSNEISKFDRYTDDRKRMIAFVNFLGDSLGTETLNAYDSYPIKISKVDSSDIYSYKKRTNSGYTRHTYNILDVTETGNFRLLWSNQQRKKEGSPMKYAEWSKLSKRPYKYMWGFRRLNYPSDYEIKQASRADYSREQYTLAKTLDEAAFFLKVKNTLKTYDESPDSNIKRHFKNLCDQAIERIDVVKSADDYRKSIGGRCMNYKEFDDYSTPSRDGRFLEQFNMLKTAVQTYKVEGTYNLVDENLKRDIYSIYNSNSSDTMKCPITIKAGVSISLKEIYQGLKNKMLSTHPNDNLDRRWGRSVGSKTRCKTWY
jgi:hypothetical protein